MPDVPALLDRCRALAAVDAIAGPDFHRYAFVPPADGRVVRWASSGRHPAWPGPSGTSWRSGR
ncbi:hypothetical protein [Streptomyces antarcticus]|uniref:hypothetical protein n=1 Tax=Streptomyces antarcticus TaxID=2996458 RepID=UPI00226F0A4B|nr:MULTISPECIES: hypothetical protein [unclassified Streptomyces]MCY0946878.1 hypothetical protein [Streptomyces sp. H34-AA3]MCZ4085622.1 hypothetical protein [Streptomyces sp. H34-S5]